MKEKKKELLKALQEKFGEWEIGTVYRDGEAEKLPMDILTVLVTEYGNSLEDVMGEFFFMPETEGQTEEILRFNCIFTLTENLEEKQLPDLYEAAGILNYYTEAGTFAVNKTGGMLVYRNSLALPAEMDTEKALELIVTNVLFSMNVSERFVDILLQVNDGRMDIEDFRALLPEEAEEE